MKTAVHSGIVEFRTAATPLSMCSSPVAMRKNGSAVAKTAVTSVFGRTVRESTMRRPLEGEDREQRQRAQRQAPGDKRHRRRLLDDHLDEQEGGAPDAAERDEDSECSCVQEMSSIRV